MKLELSLGDVILAKRSAIKRWGRHMVRTYLVVASYDDGEGYGKGYRLMRTCGGDVFIMDGSIANWHFDTEHWRKL